MRDLTPFTKLRNHPNVLCDKCHRPWKTYYGSRNGEKYCGLHDHIRRAALKHAKLEIVRAIRARNA